MSIIALNVREIASREAAAESDARKLCDYGRLLAQVSKQRVEDETGDDDMTPEELAEKAETLLAGMRKARK